MNKANNCLMIGSYVLALFLHTDKKTYCFLLDAEKHVHFGVYFYIDLGMSSLSNKWEPFF